MRFPDFVILGAMKAGSTSLFRWLEQHPGVTLPADKEPAFYSRDERWRRGLKGYAALFADIPSSQLSGEASVHYSDPAVAERAARRLHTMAPMTKLLFLVRDPAERLRSHYRHEVQRGRERRRMLEALKDAGNPYIRCSLYPEALRPWVTCFGRERLLLVDFERLVSDSEESWHNVLGFLDLPVLARPNGAHNVTADKRAYSGLMRRAYDLGLARYERRIPRALRTALKPLAFSKNAATGELIRSSRDPLPTDIEQRLAGCMARLLRDLGPVT